MCSNASHEHEHQIDLGFAEECEPNLLRNVYFPSKIGGKPAWLDLEKIPSTDDLKCKKCGAPQSFLCQIYAPIEEKPECFHRTIYIFICREPSCSAPNSAENFSAFRSQLPRQNQFYSAIPPNEDEELVSFSTGKLDFIISGLGKNSKVYFDFSTRKSIKTKDCNPVPGFAGLVSKYPHIKNDTTLQKYVQMEYGKEQSLLLDCKTRWNSLLTMIERFEQSIQKSLIDLNHPIRFDETDFNLINEAGSN